MSDAAAFLEGLRRQQEKYREMGAVAADQRRALEAGDMDRLLEIVERKRALLAEIAEIDRGVAPFREDWERRKASVDAATAKEIEATVTATREMLRELVRQEDEGRAALERQRQTAAVDLQSLLAKARARNAYRG